jgi:heme/copper-type cytochrome/quinol oxidase subunit 2
MCRFPSTAAASLPRYAPWTRDDRLQSGVPQESGASEQRWEAAMIKYILLIVVVGAVTVGTLAYSVMTWNAFGGTEMSGHGWTALILGVVFSFVVGIGLMWLVFYSNRKGYDERQHTTFDDE